MSLAKLTKLSPGIWLIKWRGIRTYGPDRRGNILTHTNTHTCAEENFGVEFVGQSWALRVNYHVKFKQKQQKPSTPAKGGSLSLWANKKNKKNTSNGSQRK